MIQKAAVVRDLTRQMSHPSPAPLLLPFSSADQRPCEWREARVRPRGGREAAGPRGERRGLTHISPRRLALLTPRATLLETSPSSQPSGTRQCIPAPVSAGGNARPPRDIAVRPAAALNDAPAPDGPSRRPDGPYPGGSEARGRPQSRGEDPRRPRGVRVALLEDGRGAL